MFYILQINKYFIYNSNLIYQLLCNIVVNDMIYFTFLRLFMLIVPLEYIIPEYCEKLYSRKLHIIFYILLYH